MGFDHLPAAGGRGGTCALILFLPVLFYSSAMQGALLLEGAKIDKYKTRTHLKLDRDNAGWLLAVPGISMLTAISDRLHLQLIQQFVGMRSVEHRNYADTRIRGWRPYEDMARDVIPLDAVMAADTTGVPSYYVPDLTVVDVLGLTDATVARNPVGHQNNQRVMAHDRRVPAGYLATRGINFLLYPAAFGEGLEPFGARYESGLSPEAVSFLRRLYAVNMPGERPEAFGARYALKVGRDLWAPFDSSDHQWVIERFGARELRIRGSSP